VIPSETNIQQLLERRDMRKFQLAIPLEK